MVDKPKAGGFGNSNDGNTGRRFFQNVDLSSKIIEIDKDKCKILDLKLMKKGLRNML